MKKEIIIKDTFFFKTRTAQMMILSLIAMTGLEKCCITSAYLQWLFHSGEQAMPMGPLVLSFSPYFGKHFKIAKNTLDGGFSSLELPIRIDL